MSTYRWCRKRSLNFLHAVSGNTATSDGAGTVGIASGAGSLVTGNTASHNSRGGISAGDYSIVSGNTANNNGDESIGFGGIMVGIGSTVTGNLVGENAGPTSIKAGDGSSVVGNTVSQFFGIGLDLGADTIYRDNTLTNSLGTTVTGGVNMGGNYCAGTGVVSASCP